MDWLKKLIEEGTVKVYNIHPNRLEGILINDFDHETDPGWKVKDGTTTYMLEDYLETFEGKKVRILIAEI